MIWKGNEDRPGGDGARLLNVKEAAERLGRSVDWLYEHADKLPFVKRTGRSVQFSAKGIDRWIANKQR